MNLSETHEDHMNRMATDIIECPSCSGEDLEIRGIEYSKDDDSEISALRCNDCGTEFEDKR